MLTGNIISKHLIQYSSDNSSCVRISNASAPSAYIVRNHYYHTLKQCFNESVEIMKVELKNQQEKLKTLKEIRDRWSTTRRHPGKMLQYNVTAIDRYWSKYQQNDHFIIFNPALGKQNDLFNGNYQGNDT